MPFEPKDYLVPLKGSGNKLYLPVSSRIHWFRLEQPNGNIQTDLVAMEPFIVVKATVYNNEGIQVASGYGTAPAYGNGLSSWKGREVEKAETAAIGRTLAVAGYGTQFTDDFDEDEHLADSPVERKSQTTKAQAKPATQAPANNSGTTQVRVTEITTKMTKGDKPKPFIIAGGVSFFSREMFEKASYDVSEWHNIGTHSLPYACFVEYAIDDKGFKVPVNVYASME